MSEIQAVDYSTLVKQVYIDPIRTVVIVDDDFPTLDGLLSSAQVAPLNVTSNQESATATASPAVQNGDGTVAAAPEPKQTINMQFKGQIAEVKRVREMIELCRRHTPPWLVDVHDGSPDSGLDELTLAPWLHHSDLMILDYHLDGDHGDGKRALEILKKLAASDQFNLIVVYTKGVAGGIRDVHEQIATTLTYREWPGPLSAGERNTIRSLIQDWEVEDAAIEVEKGLLSYVSTQMYFQYRTGILKFDQSGFKPLLTNFLLKCPEEVRNKVQYFDDGKGDKGSVKLHAKLLFEYAIALKHQELYDSLSPDDYGSIACDFDADLNWLRLEKIFVTVVNKNTTAPATIEACLLKSLEKWAPGPHRLLMGKMRAQLCEKGVGAEGIVLANRSLQGGWLHELLSDATDAESITTQSINRHWEALGDIIYLDVKRFAIDICQYFRNADQTWIKERYLPSELGREVQAAHLNYYYSAKPIDSRHLTTGQVFELTEPDTPEEKVYWICLSPACDLVPGQKNSGWKKRLGSAMPFVAVQLDAVKMADALKHINHNRFVFVQIDEEIQAFQFTRGDGSSLPVWEQMFADDAGKFADRAENERHALTIQRMLDEDGRLALKFYEAKVVCQLRYEYALNLLQRLGHALSRVGLDFRVL